MCIRTRPKPLQPGPSWLPGSTPAGFQEGFSAVHMMWYVWMSRITCRKSLRRCVVSYGCRSRALHVIRLIACVKCMYAYVYTARDPRVWKARVHVQRKRSLYLPLGSVNLVLKVMGTPNEISSPPGCNRVSPGWPKNFNTELTEPTRQIKTTFPMNVWCLMTVDLELDQPCRIYAKVMSCTWEMMTCHAYSLCPQQAENIQDLVVHCAGEILLSLDFSLWTGCWKDVRREQEVSGKDLVADLVEKMNKWEVISTATLRRISKRYVYVYIWACIYMQLDIYMLHIYSYVYVLNCPLLGKPRAAGTC